MRRYRGSTRLLAAHAAVAEWRAGARQGALADGRGAHPVAMMTYNRLYMHKPMLHCVDAFESPCACGSCLAGAWASGGVVGMAGFLMQCMAHTCVSRRASHRLHGPNRPHLY